MPSLNMKFSNSHGAQAKAWTASDSAQFRSIAPLLANPISKIVADVTVNYAVVYASAIRSKYTWHDGPRYG